MSPLPKFALLAALLVLICIAPLRAQAHQIPNRSSKRIKALPLRAQLRWYRRNARHARNTIHWWRTRGSWAFEGKRYPTAYHIGASDLRQHRSLLRNSLRHIHHINAKLASTLPRLCWACWDRVASCESTGRWSLNTGNSYYGGLQFTYDTWLSAGGARYASRADLATRVQQIIVASSLSLSNWPICGSRY